MPSLEPASPLAEALDRVGDRWTLLVVDALMDGPRRFNDLTDSVAGIAPNILSRRLKTLERDGLVVARPYSTRPPRLSYSLTASGRDLGSAVRSLAQWGAKRTGQADLAHHGACGTAMELRWYCPTCARTVDEAETTDLRLV